MSSEIIDGANCNTLTKTFILSHNGVIMTKEILWPNDSIYLVKILKINFTPILFHCLKYLFLVKGLIFICLNKRFVKAGLTSHF